MATQETTDDERIGQYVRMLRRARSLTLTQLAALADLSQPFLSQLERGQARPSMASLGRIARALGSSQLEIISGAATLTTGRPAAAAGLVRADQGDRGRYGLGMARLLVTGDRPFSPMLFDADNTDPGEFHRHVEHEFLHVLEGACRVDLDADGVHELSVGDSLFYLGGTPHRWSSTDGSPYRLFVVKQHLAVPGSPSAAAPDLTHDLQES
jgi:transcriptional regulator with XRE-family HTH domain